MFLKEFWQFNRSGAVCLLLFVVIWTYLNYKQGAIATPILQFGMYSGKYYTSDTQYVQQLYVNNQKLDFTKYSMSDRDQLQYYPQKFLLEKDRNERVFIKMKQLFGKVGLAALMQKDKYTNRTTCDEFGRWYRNKVAAITAKKINELSVFEQKYIWLNGMLTPVGTPLKISCIAPN